jgi:hypothetical protein
VLIGVILARGGEADGREALRDKRGAIAAAAEAIVPEDQSTVIPGM